MSDGGFGYSSSNTPYSGFTDSTPSSTVVATGVGDASGGNDLTNAQASSNGGVDQSGGSGGHQSVDQSSGSQPSYDVATGMGQSYDVGTGQYSHTSYENLTPYSQATLEAAHGGDSVAAQDAYHSAARAVIGAAGAVFGSTTANAMELGGAVPATADVPVGPFDEHLGAFGQKRGDPAQGAAAASGGAYVPPSPPVPVKPTADQGQMGAGTIFGAGADTNPYEPGSIGYTAWNAQHAVSTYLDPATNGYYQRVQAQNDLAAKQAALAIPAGSAFLDRGPYGPPMPAQVLVRGVTRPDVPPSSYHEALPPPPGTPIDFSGAAATLRPVGADTPAGMTDPTRATWLPDTKAAQATAAPDVAAPQIPAWMNPSPTGEGTLRETAAAGDILSNPALVEWTPSAPTAAAAEQPARAVANEPVLRPFNPVPVKQQANVPLPRVSPLDAAVPPTPTPPDVPKKVATTDVLVAPQPPASADQYGPYGYGQPYEPSSPSEPAPNQLVPAAAAGVPIPQARPLTPNIVQGDRGENVRQFQQQLINAGYSVGRTGADGIAGPKTIAAMQKMEKDVGITRMTNRAGPEVSRALEDIPSAVPQPISPTVAQRAALGRPEAPWYTSQPLAPIGGKRADAGNALTDQQTAMGVTIPRDAAAAAGAQPGVQVAGNDQGIPYQDNQGNVISNTDKYGLPLSVSPPVVEMNDPVTGERKNYTLEQYMQTFPDADPIDFHQMANPINRLQDQGGGEGVPMSALPAQGVQVALMAGTGGQQPSVTQDDLSQYTPTQQKLIDRLGTLGEQDISRIIDRIDTSGVPGEETAVVPYGEKAGMKLGDDANPKGIMTWSGVRPGIGLNQMQDLPDRYYPPMRPGDEQYYRSDPGNPMGQSPATDQMWKQEDRSFPPQVMNALPAQSIQDGQYYLFTDPQTGIQTLRRANRSGGQTAVG